MEHKCCPGSERVVLSGDKKESPVSRLTFTLRDFSQGDVLCLATECKKEGALGKCFAGVTFYGSDEIMPQSNPFKYEITSEKLSEYCFNFIAPSGADKAELTIHCTGEATLIIEKIKSDLAQNV